MAFDSREGLPRLGVDFDLERWTDGTRDNEGKLIWNHSYPDNNQWDSVRQVTLNLDPQGEGDYRNYPIQPGRPLDIPGTYEGQDVYFDIYDLADQALSSYGIEYA